ncbi:hypothetical protein F6476_04000 [Pseudomonas umsongensis]|nr:hypothetical protein F6476_04000 [Pseudomonas umsongensis]
MQRKNFSHRGRLPFVINQLIKRRRCAAPEWLKIKRVPHTKQSDNRLSVRLSNTLLSGYRFVLPMIVPTLCVASLPKRTQSAGTIKVKCQVASA